VFEVSDSFFGSREYDTVETKALSERMSELPDEELLRLASLSAQVMHDGTQSGPCVTLAAVCNCELIIRRSRVKMS
jgi:hypothetical protein